MLPESIVGEAFLEKYTDHNDPVTVIDPKQTYVVRAPARHPIYENFRVKVSTNGLILSTVIYFCDNNNKKLILIPNYFGFLFQWLYTENFEQLWICFIRFCSI